MSQRQFQTFHHTNVIKKCHGNKTKRRNDTFKNMCNVRKMITPPWQVGSYFTAVALTGQHKNLQFRKQCPRKI